MPCASAYLTWRVSNLYAVARHSWCAVGFTNDRRVRDGQWVTPLSRQPIELDGIVVIDFDADGEARDQDDRC
jgi:hypothetical protein